MRLLSLALVALVASPVSIVSGAVMAASAHNSQAGGFGDSQNPTDSTPSSPRVKHAAKHKVMRKAL